MQRPACNRVGSKHFTKKLSRSTLRRSKAKSTCDRVGLCQTRTRCEIENATARLQSRRVEALHEKGKHASACNRVGTYQTQIVLCHHELSANVRDSLQPHFSINGVRTFPLHDDKFYLSCTTHPYPQSNWRRNVCTFCCRT